MATDTPTTIPPENPPQSSNGNMVGESVTRESFQEPSDIASRASTIEQEDSDLDSVFDEGEDGYGGWGLDEEWEVRNFNRQVPLHPNQQKPAANTFASVDDQIAALSKHAAKIRLDDVKEGKIG